MSLDPASAPAIHHLDGFSVEPVLDYLGDTQQSLDIFKSVYVSFPAPNFAILKGLVGSLNADDAPLVSTPNGDTLSLPPSGYLSALLHCVNTFDLLNEREMRELEASETK
jgi:hypothetical protein